MLRLFKLVNAWLLTELSFCLPLHCRVVEQRTTARVRIQKLMKVAWAMTLDSGIHGFPTAIVIVSLVALWTNEENHFHCPPGLHCSYYHSVPPFHFFLVAVVSSFQFFLVSGHCCEFSLLQVYGGRCLNGMQKLNSKITFWCITETKSPPLLGNATKDSTNNNEKPTTNSQQIRT